LVIQYNDRVLEHFRSPRNVGRMDSADGFGEQVSEICGDHMLLYLKIADGRISDINFLSLGCAASIASGSILTEMVKGKALQEAERVTTQDIVDALGGLPEPKIHCSVLAADCLRKAIEDYRSRLPSSQ